MVIERRPVGTFFSSSSEFRNYCLEIHNRIEERKKREELRKQTLKELSNLLDTNVQIRERERLKALAELELLVMGN